MREKQIGSIRTFFAIGIVLALVLVGSIFYLKNRGEAALIAQKASNSQESKASESAKSDKESKNDSTKDKASEKPVVKAPENNDSNGEKVVASDLPTTGPESTAAEMALLFMATFILTSFVQSKILKPARSIDKNC